uniref:Uncharacterized protein n=1 Tax=Ananas comosus var. bracteatus TaxID=296719 RepID=A0A6V7NHM1_ANACO|nr:unnamed protein product [Ananas comosus var. bracteatus]
MCVLKNCEEVSPNVREHIEEVQSKYDSDVELRHEEQFLVVVKTQPRDLYDVPTIERSANDQEESTSTPIPENENIGDFDRIDGDEDHDDLCNFELARADVEEIVFDAMVGESKNSIIQVKKSNRASTSSRRTVECRSKKPWLRSQSQNSEPTPPLSEDPHASTHLPSTITDRPSSPTIANPDTNTTASSSNCCCQPAAGLLLVQLAASSYCCQPADAASSSSFCC